MSKSRPASEARERILETAERLFYQDGVRAVGVDRIISEAGVAKMTLYGHFPSKDDLILAFLQRKEEACNAFFAEGMRRHAGAATRLEAFFAALAEFVGDPKFRGCAFINAVAELADCRHPGSVFARDCKTRFRGFIAGLAQEATGRPAAATSEAIGLLVEGALVVSAIQKAPDSVAIARQAALDLVRQARLTQS